MDSWITELKGLRNPLDRKSEISKLLYEVRKLMALYYPDLERELLYD